MRCCSELRAVRKSGVALDHEEHTIGICAAGVVLRDPLGNDIAISVPVPAQRFADQQKQIVERLKATARLVAGAPGRRRGVTGAGPAATLCECAAGRAACTAGRLRMYAQSIQAYHILGQAAGQSRC